MKVISKIELNEYLPVLSFFFQKDRFKNNSLYNKILILGIGKKEYFYRDIFLILEDNCYVKTFQNYNKMRSDYIDGFLKINDRFSFSNQYNKLLHLSHFIFVKDKNWFEKNMDFQIKFRIYEYTKYHCS